MDYQWFNLNPSLWCFNVQKSACGISATCSETAEISQIGISTCTWKRIWQRFWPGTTESTTESTTFILTLGTISAFAWTSGEIWLSNCQEDMFIPVGKFIFCIPFFLFPGDIINLTGQSGVYQTRSGHVWNVNCFAVTLRH